MAGVLGAIKSAGSKVSDGIGSLAGNLPKAILFVREYQKDLLWSQGNLDAARVQAEENSVLVSLFEGEDAYAENVEYNVNAWKQEAASNAMSSTNMYMNNLQQALEGGNALSGNGTTAFTAAQTAAKNAGYVAMEVQYNPSTIYLDTSAGLREIENSSISNIMSNQRTQINTKAITTLGLQLVFDAMNQMDAFMMDASMLSSGGLLSLGMDVAKNKNKKVNGVEQISEGFTVRPQVEGLIACLLSPLTRRVIFAWAGMVFKGELNTVNANYTMFNKKGNPIRATVEIAIQQDSDAEKFEKNSHWNKAFTKAFGDVGMDNTVGAKSLGDKIKNNNLLNVTM